MAELKGFKFVAILVLEFKKVEKDDETKHSTFSCSSKVKSIINESDIDDVFEPICSQIISYIQTLLGKGLSWIFGSVVDRAIKILNTSS